jgi:hypothetical protein
MNFNTLNFKKQPNKENDVRYLNASGDEMTGALSVPSLMVNGIDINSVISTAISTALSNFSTVPTGTIISSMSTNTPSGYLPMIGQAYLKSDYPALGSQLSGIGWENLSPTTINTSTHFYIVDLRGAFLRGSGANTYYQFVNNTGNSIGGFQLDAIKKHKHTYSRDTTTAAVNSNAGMFNVRDNNSTTNFTADELYNANNVAIGEQETRPFNCSICWYIKI